jgi:hypothetical protein
VTPVPPGLAQTKRPRDPGQFYPSVPIRLLAAGFLVSAILAFRALPFIGRAWAACTEVGLGEGVLLLFIALPLTIGLWMTFGASLLPTIGRPRPARFVVGGLVVLGATLIFMTVMVPRPGDPPQAADARTDCRADGIPTWWPSWLPS